MRMLMVQTPTSHLGAGERVYPLGLARLARELPAAADVRGIDLNLSPDPWADFRDRLMEFRPETVLLSFRNLDPLAGHQTSYFSSLQTAARMIRALIPDARILAGGPAFSLFARRLMGEIPEIDAGLVGEGEIALPRLLADGADAAPIPGLAFRIRNGIRINPPETALDLGRLKMPDTGLFDPAHYLAGNRYVSVMGIEAKRGCDLNCGYCLYPLLGGRRMRLRPPVKVVEEMALLHREHGVASFHFTDSVINRPPDHFEAICEELIRRRLPVTWTGFFREDALTSAQCDLALRAGLSAVYFSGDALTDHGLKLLNKRLTREDLLSAARVTAETGVLTMCHFLMNLPGELPDHENQARETLDRLLEIHAPAGNLGAVIFNTVRLYPDAPLTRRLLRTGALDPAADLLWPVYYNPLPTARLLHECQAICQGAGAFSHLGIPPPTREHRS